MTIGNKMQQTIASAESVAASLKTFALDTNDQTAKSMFNNLLKSQESIVNDLKGRLKYIQQQEPEYKEL